MSHHIHPFETLPLRHYFMFGQVMQKPQICQLFLEELFGWPIEKIEYVDREKDITDSYTSRGIRLDIYVKNSSKVYNVEMQADKESALEHRIRYYQSGIDREELKCGSTYDQLPETFIIFICNYDPLRKGSAVYKKQMIWEGEDLPYEDGTHAIILNSHYTKGNASPAILELLDYIKSNDDSVEYSSALVKQTKEQVLKVRLDRELGVRYMLLELKMYDNLRRGLEEGRREGKIEGETLKLIQMICRKLSKGKSPEVIADELEENLSAVQVICDAAREFAPDYDVEKIYNVLSQK